MKPRRSFRETDRYDSDVDRKSIVDSLPVKDQDRLTDEADELKASGKKATAAQQALATRLIKYVDGSGLGTILDRSSNPFFRSLTMELKTKDKLWICFTVTEGGGNNSNGYSRVSVIELTGKKRYLFDSEGDGFKYGTKVNVHRHGSYEDIR